MVIITGLHRSGTTFLGNIIEISKKYNYIHEPFNFNHGVLDVPCWYPYVNPTKFSSEEEQLKTLLNDLYRLKLKFKRTISKDDTPIEKLGRYFIKSREHLDYLKYKLAFKKKEVLFKDPFLSICGSYLAHKYDDVKIVYIVRHPVAIYESLKRMQWHFDFANLRNQKSLVRDYLTEPNFETFESTDLIYSVSSLWNIINKIIYDHANFLGSSKSLIIKHEDLSIDPLTEIEKIFTFLNISISDNVQAYIKRNMYGETVSPDSKVLFEFKRNSKELAYSWKKNFKPEYQRLIDYSTATLDLFNY